jgi:hypothetical protein
VPLSRLTLGQIALALLLPLLLNGCASGRQFFYNRLPTVLPWYLERYVDLDRAQAERFDEQVDAALAWHRAQELPRYIDLLDDIEARLDRPFAAADVVAVTDAAEAAWYRLRDRALEELLILGATLSEEQIAEFLDSLDERQEKYERKYLQRSDEEYREDAAENLREGLEDYLGRLDEAQRETIAAAAARLRRSDSVWLDERQRWMDMLRRELSRAPGWEARIRREIRDWEASLDEKTAAVYEHNTAVVQGAIAAVVDARSERQDEALRKELAGLREDLVALVDSGRSGTFTPSL